VRSESQTPVPQNVICNEPNKICNVFLIISTKSVSQHVSLNMRTTDSFNNEFNRNNRDSFLRFSSSLHVFDLLNFHEFLPRPVLHIPFF
jgi:hypothetical protein